MDARDARAVARAVLVTGVLGALLVAPGDTPVDAVRAAVVQGEGGAVTAPAAPPTADPPTPAGRPVVVPRGDGVLAVVPLSQPAPAPEGSVQRYVIEVEGGLGIDPAAFATAAQATLEDPRSWSAGGRPALQRVDEGPVDFRLVLASPALTDELCAPLRTGGRFSCFQGGRAVINAMRWLTGADAYAGRLDDYRHYVVNHEVGHALGRGHAGCPRAGDAAPVMMQQTKGVGACTPNAWPFP